MPRTLVRISIALSFTMVMVWSMAAPIGSAAGAHAALAGTSIRSVYVREPRPSMASQGKRMQVLIALHGMGGNGEAFAKDLVDQADRYGWLLVAPTIDYGDWTKPDLIAREDPMLIQALADYLDQLPQSTGIPVRRQVLLLGHSRGAQLAHRFAEFRPDKVLAVAALSAGTYTLPLTSGPQGGLAFPYGVTDLAQYGGRAFDASKFENIPFWLGVGAQDTNPADLPRQWDTYEGTTRVQRAQAFEAAMREMGASAVLKVFGNTRHEVTSEMRQAACAFLGKAMLSRAPYGTPLAARPVSF